MKVLVFGATGFIGHDAALALVRAGHEVYGVTRSAESAKKLELAEITPRVADPSDASTWRHLVGEVDAVIDAVGGNDIATVGHLILDTVLEEAKKARPHGPPLSYIYCSGTWVHGDDKVEAISDRSPITKPMKATSWRIEIENKATSNYSKSFTGNVIRPSILYGSSGSLTAMLFASAKAGTIEWYGSNEQRVPTIHQADLGEAFRLVTEKAYAIPSIIFDVSNDHPESMAEIMHELQAVSGAKDIKYKEPENEFHRALASSANLRPTLARSLLGWAPRRLPLAQGMKIYYHAWLASTA